MSSIQWGDFPTWVTAAATLLAAVGAFFAAGIAFRQLKGQRHEIQRQGVEQQRLAALQTKQLEQLNRQAETIRRAQADRIMAERARADVQYRGINADTYEAVIVKNGSTRPIRNLRCRIEQDGVLYASKAAHLGPPPQPLAEAVDELPKSSREPIRIQYADGELWFLFPVPFERTYRVFRLRFEDDAESRWELDQDMHLVEQPDEAW